MLQSQLFTKTLKQPPKDEISPSSKFLIQGGFVDKLMAGVYTFLPLGFLVFKKIENIIREEMLALGAQEIFMPSLTPKNIWEQTGRWSTFTDLYKFKDVSKKDLALAATHEEIITPIVKKYVNSYRDLPLAVFQIQNKFRSELRVKAGLIRGREFIMKDLYSFHCNLTDLDKYYNKVIEAYFKIFNRVGIGKVTYLTLASGGAFSKYSHEFQTISESGEDTIYLCPHCQIAVNKEIKNEQKICSKCQKKDFQEKKGIEVGNIFKLIDRFSRPFNLTYRDEKGQDQIVYMASYGIGLGRLMATIVEINHDEEGIIWPKTVTPYQLHLIDIENKKTSNNFYQKLTKEGFKVLYDDRNLSAGEKLKDADLIGINVRLVASRRLKDKLEIKYRSEKTTKINDFKTTINKLKYYFYHV